MLEPFEGIFFTFTQWKGSNLLDVILWWRFKLLLKSDQFVDRLMLIRGQGFDSVIQDSVIRSQDLLASDRVVVVDAHRAVVVIQSIAVVVVVVVNDVVVVVVVDGRRGRHGRRRRRRVVNDSMTVVDGVAADDEAAVMLMATVMMVIMMVVMVRVRGRVDAICTDAAAAAATTTTTTTTTTIQGGMDRPDAGLLILVWG